MPITSKKNERHSVTRDEQIRLEIRRQDMEIQQSKEDRAPTEISSRPPEAVHMNIVRPEPVRKLAIREFHMPWRFKQNLAIRNAGRQPGEVDFHSRAFPPRGQYIDIAARFAHGVL